MTLNYKSRIDKVLKNFFIEQHKEIRGQHALAKKLLKSLDEFTNRPGAKRIRGSLVLLGYLSNPRKKIDNNILKIAAAYEILHTYLLIHDDIIDEDVIRRGKPTLHKVFESYTSKNLPKKQKEKVGTDLAIIAGDLAADLVQKLILNTKFSEAKKINILSNIEKTLRTTYVGQILDILAVPYSLPKISEQKLRYELKTAKYSIETPFLLGVNLANAKIKFNLFKKFATNAGVGFQLSDDLQNVFSKGLAGRSSDIRHGKVTLLMSYSLQSAKYRVQIIKLLKKNKKSTKDIYQLRNLIKLSGGLSKAKKLVEKKYIQAEKILPLLKLPTQVNKEFGNMISKFWQAYNSIK